MLSSSDSSLSGNASDRPDQSEPNGLRLIKRMKPALGCFVEIGVYQSGEHHHAIGAAFEVIDKIEQLMSFHNPDSELTRLNACTGAWVPLSHHTLRVLRLARAMTRQTRQAFNCTVGGALVMSGRLPRHRNSDLIAIGEAKDIQISEGRARLTRPVLVTLDGIAKGYAVDQAVRVLRREGVKAGWVNAGGDLRAFGASALRVDVQDMHQRHVSLHRVKDRALATSVLTSTDPHRFPAQMVGSEISDRSAAEPGSNSISVQARFAWRADALTKLASHFRGAQLRQAIADLRGQLLCEAEGR